MSTWNKIGHHVEEMMSLAMNLCTGGRKPLLCNTMQLVKLKSFCQNSYSTTKRYRKYPIKKSAVGLENEMQSRARAWSFHPTVYRWLKKDVLIKRKYIKQIVSHPIKKEMTDTKSIKREVQSAHNLTATELLILMPKVLQVEEQRVFHLKKLEKLCCEHLFSLSINQILYIMDIFFEAEFRAPMFYRNAFQLIEMKLYALDIEPKDIVQLLFYSSAYRNCSVELLRCLEEMITEHIQEFTGDEIGLICHAFFATNTSFHSFKLMKTISMHALTELQDNHIKPYMIGNILKALRHAGYENLTFYQSLCEAILPRIENKGYLKASIELLNSFSSVGFLHLNFCCSLVELVSRSLERNSFNLRLKELVKLVSGCMNLGVECPDALLDRLQHILEAREAAVEYPEMFVDGLVALGMSGRYPTELLSWALSSTFIKLKAGRRLEQHFQMLLLDTMAAVKCPGYSGNRLSQDYLLGLAADVFCDINKELEYRQGLSSVIASLQRLTGDRCVRCHSVNRFSSLPDIELNIDSTNKALPILPNSDLPKIVPKHRTGDVSIIASLTGGQEFAVNRDNPGSLHLEPAGGHHSGVRKAVVKVLGWNQFAVNSPTLLGLHRYDLHLLQAQGYEVLTVSPFDAARIEIMTFDEQDDFVKSNILQKLRCDVLGSS